MENDLTSYREREYWTLMWDKANKVIVTGEVTCNVYDKQDTREDEALDALSQQCDEPSYWSMVPKETTPTIEEAKQKLLEYVHYKETQHDMLD